MSPTLALLVLFASGYEAVRNLPCTTQDHEDAIVATLAKVPMTAESYGVIRNIAAPREGMFLEAALPPGWSYKRDDDWYAAQALIVELAPRNEATGRMATSEIVMTSSAMLFDLVKMLRQMGGEPFPYTAFLTLANRIDSEFIRDGNECMLAYDAARLVQLLDPPLISADPSFKDAGDCGLWLIAFREWLRSHRGELERGAVAEREKIERARERMSQVSLCRH